MFDRRLLANFDWYLLGLVLAICLIGVIAIYSAEQGYSGQTHYWSRQLTWLGVGLLAGFVVLLVDFRTIGSWAYVLHGLVVAALAALILVDTAGGVDRWFVVGPVSVQPSEFAKLSSVLALAYYFRDSRRVGDLGLRGVVVPTLLVAVPFGLIVQQPDLGTAMLLLLGFFPVIVLAGIRLRLLAGLAGAGLVAVSVLVASFQLGTYRIEANLPQVLERKGADPAVVEQVRQAVGREFASRLEIRRAFFGEGSVQSDAHLQVIAEETFHPYISNILRPYQQRRLLTFLNPEKDPLGAGYHIIQSRVAIGSGGLWGKGYGESTQGSLNFLPARHTDFLFSIFAEEWGFAGVLVLLSLFTALIYHGLRIVLQTKDRFSAFLTMGVIAIVTSQVLINLGMVVGLLPVVGVPLPFFSYGGSSLVSLLIGIALILNIRMRRFLWT